MNLLNPLLAFFGISQGTHKRGNIWVKTPVGNRALPKAEQSEIMICAHNKRIRKDEKRRAVHFYQKKLGHHKFA